MLLGDQLEEWDLKELVKERHLLLKEFLKLLPRRQWNMGYGKSKFMSKALVLDVNLQFELFKVQD